MEEVTTLFDSDEAENEYMKEQEAKRRKAEKEYIDREWLLNEGIRVTSGYNNDGVIMIPMRDVRESIQNAPAADVAPRAEIAEEIFNEIAKMFSEKQRSYENSHQSGKARQMMVARFEVHKLHQKYKEDHNGK